MSVNFFSSVETYSYQTDESSSSIVTYDGFDDLTGPMDGNDEAFTGQWTPEGESEYYGLKINNAEEIEYIDYSYQYEKWKRGLRYDTSAELLDARPVNATYTHVLHSMDEDNEPNFVDVEVDITAPDVAFTDALPATPMFSISGVDGIWSTGDSGIGVFTFDPNSVNEFTVTMSLYQADHQGNAYAYGATVGAIDGAYETVGHESSGIVDVQPDDVGKALTAGGQITLTFTKDLAANGGDDVDTTYGFGDDSAFELEGEFVNAWLESGTDGETAALKSAFGITDPDDLEIQKGFIYQTVTAIELRADVAAVPEPSSVSLLGLGSLALLLRRKRA